MLLSQVGSPVLHCSDICRNIAPSFSEDLKAMGRLPDGTLWALEGRGTLWKDDGTGRVPEKWSRSTSNRMSNGSYLSLYKEPWMRAPKLLAIPVVFMKSVGGNTALIAFGSGLFLMAVIVVLYRIRLRKD